MLEAAREWQQYEQPGSALITLSVYARNDASRRLLTADSLKRLFRDAQVKGMLKTRLRVELLEVYSTCRIQTLVLQQDITIFIFIKCSQIIKIMEFIYVRMSIDSSRNPCDGGKREND